tara:strand:+ start:2357 stop:2704 length:348 start_codon:yes stop_codon:yes gene_type:complete
MKTVFKRKGDVILEEGEESYDAYIIMKGEVDVSKNGKHIITLEENNIFGEIALVDRGPRTATCTAKTNVTLGQVTRDTYISLLKYRPEVVNPIMRIVVDRLRNLTDMLQDMSSIK